MKKTVLMALCLTGIMSCNRQADVQWIASSSEYSWQTQSPDGVEFLKGDKFDVEIDVLNPQQTIDGFGSCFNELGWVALSILSDNDRESVMRELFEPGVGANFTICRMSVAANDFARNWYSYNETEGDFEMKNFSIDNDKETLVPFIKDALKHNPDIRIWASPWSPPSWMKYGKHYACDPTSQSTPPEYSNNMKPEQRGWEGVNMFIQEDDYFKAYALYFTKFIEAYRKENINIFMIMPQNEFNSCQPFPSCTWTAEGLNRFVGRHLGPNMEKLGVEIMFGTMERPNAQLVDTLLEDPESGRHIRGVGFQWAGKEAIASIHKRYSNLKLYQTEQECGNGKNDWKHCLYAWKLMKHYFNNGVSVYEYWNTALKDGGTSRWGWSQNSLVTVNPTDRTYKFTHEYYLMKHVSRYVRSGAVLLPSAGEFTDLLAFRNTDGSFVIVLRNDKNETVKKAVKIGDKIISIALPPNSFNTVVI